MAVFDLLTTAKHEPFCFQSYYLTDNAEQSDQTTQRVRSYEILRLRQQNKFTVLPAAGHKSSVASMLLMFGMPIFNSDQFSDPIYRSQINSCNCPVIKQSLQGQEGDFLNLLHYQNHYHVMVILPCRMRRPSFSPLEAR